MALNATLVEPDTFAPRATEPPLVCIETVEPVTFALTETNPPVALAEMVGLAIEPLMTMDPVVADRETAEVAAIAPETVRFPVEESVALLAVSGPTESAAEFVSEKVFPVEDASEAAPVFAMKTLPAVLALMEAAAVFKGASCEPMSPVSLVKETAGAETRPAV